MRKVMLLLATTLPAFVTISAHAAPPNPEIPAPVSRNVETRCVRMNIDPRSLEGQARPLPRASDTSSEEEEGCDQPVRQEASDESHYLPQAVLGGWAESTTQFNNSSWFNSLSIAFYVPDSPPSDNQTFYIFPGLETRGTPSGFKFPPILQPVLQFGNNAVCGQNFDQAWLMTDVFVNPAGQASCGPQQEVYPGDYIVAGINVDPDNPNCSTNGLYCNWQVWFYDTTRGSAGTALELTNLPWVFSAAYPAVLETPVINHCSDLPPGTFVGQPGGGPDIFFGSAQLTQPGSAANDFSQIVAFNPTPALLSNMGCSGLGTPIVIASSGVVELPTNGH